jgi:hypothetical protein
LLSQDVIVATTPDTPSSGPVTGSFNGLHRESNFLAKAHRRYHPKDILAQRSVKLRSWRMNFPPKPPNLAKSRQGLELFLTETPLTEAPKYFFRPLFPRNPHFPVRRSGPMALSGASRRKQSPAMSAGPIITQPGDGPDVGEDKKPFVGPYEKPSRYKAAIESVLIEIGK